MISNTNFVLINISTFPVLIYLPDYCRDDKCKCPNQATIETTWPYIKQARATDNEIITIYFEPQKWEYSDNKE